MNEKSVPNGNVYVPQKNLLYAEDLPTRCFECGNEIGDCPPEAGVLVIGMVMGALMGFALTAVGFWMLRL